MLEKTIKQVLKKKVNQWLDSIDDENVKHAIEKDLIITGGCFTSMILNEEIKDFDCYLRTKESVLVVANYYINKWNEEKGGKETGRGDIANVFVLDGANPSQKLLDFYGIEKLSESASHMISNTPPDRVKIIFPSDGIVGDPKEVRAREELGTAEQNIEEIDEVKADEILEREKKMFFPVFLSTNAITLSNGIQVVVRFYGEAGEVHDTFDFIHTRAYYDLGKDHLEIPKDVYEHTINKTLKYTGSKYPICSLFRLRKFISRGWTINAGQILLMSYQVSELDLNDIDVLQEQLIGTDSLYFMNLIHQFREQKRKDSNFELTSNYVMSIIDKIF